MFETPILQTDIDADDALSQQQAHTTSPKLMEAIDFLEEQLENGPKRQAKIEEAAKAKGHTHGTIKRAKKELSITSHKDRFSGGWKFTYLVARGRLVQYAR